MIVLGNFEVKLRKQSSCSVQLTNKTGRYIAFKVKTTKPKKYCVRPNRGVVLPGSTCNVTVIMQAQKEAPLEQCRDNSSSRVLLRHMVQPTKT
ncbi:hypothetical protein DITRI_Ditri13aG0021100 [Diplodiscus trichospermus]